MDGELRFKPSASEVAQTTLSKASHFLQTPSWRGGHPATPTSCLPPTPPQCQHDRRTMPPTIFQHKTAYRQNSFYRTRTIASWNCLPPEVVMETFISWIYPPPPPHLPLPPPPPPGRLPPRNHSGGWLVEYCFTSTETVGLLGREPSQPDLGAGIAQWLEHRTRD